MAAAMMTDEQICTLMEWDHSRFRLAMMDRCSEVYKIVEGARLTITMAVNKSIIDCARQGSGPAQAMAKRLEEQMIQSRFK